jgi:hypothetical protein
MLGFVRVRIVPVMGGATNVLWSASIFVQEVVAMRSVLRKVWNLMVRFIEVDSVFSVHGRAVL